VLEDSSAADTLAAEDSTRLEAAVVEIMVAHSPLRAESGRS
jgi:hypothetical protein